MHDGCFMMKSIVFRTVFLYLLCLQYVWCTGNLTERTTCSYYPRNQNMRHMRFMSIRVVISQSVEFALNEDLSDCVSVCVFVCLDDKKVNYKEVWMWGSSVNIYLCVYDVGVMT
jgi:hypothetical protein